MLRDIGVGEHALYFACIAPIVSFVIPLECILGVVMQIYGNLVAGSSWHIEYQDIAPVVFAILHVFLLQDVCAAMSLVVYVVPKLLFVFARLLQSDAVKCEFPKIREAKASGNDKGVVMKKEEMNQTTEEQTNTLSNVAVGIAVIIVLLALILFVRKRRKSSQM